MADYSLADIIISVSAYISMFIKEHTAKLY